jgi:hypothetical protein
LLTRCSGFEEDLAMSDGARAPGGPGREPGEEASSLDGAREAALIRKVLRVLEQHREGGVERELDIEDEEEREPDA